MKKTQLYARESVVFDHELAIVDSTGAPVDITGWTFALVLARQAGSPDVTLGMAASSGDQGFEVVDGANGALRMVADQATLAGIGDTTGDFTMFGDLLGTPPGGDADLVADIRMNVTTAGNAFGGGTTKVSLDAVGAALRTELQGYSAAALAASGPTYASTAAGLAATPSGKAFAVDNGDGTGSVYLNNAGTAAFQRKFIVDPSSPTGASSIGTADGGTVEDQLAVASGPLAPHGGAPANTGAQNRDAFAAAFAAGVTRLALAPGTYTVDKLAGTEPVHDYTTGQQPNIIAPEGLTEFDGLGATLNFPLGRGIKVSGHQTWGYPFTISYLSAAVVAGDDALPLVAGEGAKWAVGDKGIWRLGSLSFDLPETLNWGIFTVVDVAGDTVTIDRPMPEAFDPASVAGSSYTSNFGTTWYNKGLFAWPIAENQRWHDFIGTGVLADSTHKTEEGLTVRGARNIVVERVGMRKVGVGFAFQYAERCALIDCWVEDTHNFQVSVGTGFSFSETRAIDVVRPRVKGALKAFQVEAGGEAHIVSPLIENTGDWSTGASYGGSFIAFNGGGKGQMVVRDPTITGYGGYVLVADSTGDTTYDMLISIEGLCRLIHPAEVGTIKLKALNCLLDYQIAGTREVWDFARPRVMRRRIMLKNAMNASFYLARGPIKRARVYASSGLTFGAGNALTGLYFARPTGSPGTNYASATYLTAGRDAVIDFVGGDGGGDPWYQRASQLRLAVQTGSPATTLNTADQYIDVEVELAVDRLTPGFAWSSETDQRMSHPAGDVREALFTAYDLPSIAANASTVVNFTVPNMANNDEIMAVEWSGNMGTAVHAASADALGGLAAVKFTNTSGAAVDLAAADIRILWRKPLLGA